MKLMMHFNDWITYDSDTIGPMEYAMISGKRVNATYDRGNEEIKFETTDDAGYIHCSCYVPCTSNSSERYEGCFYKVHDHNGTEYYIRVADARYDFPEILPNTIIDCIDYCTIMKKAIDDFIEKVSSATKASNIIEDLDNIWKVYNKDKTTSLTIDKTQKDIIMFTMSSKYKYCDITTRHTIKLDACYKATITDLYDYLKNSIKLLGTSHMLSLNYSNTSVFILIVNNAIREIFEPLTM